MDGYLMLRSANEFCHNIEILNEFEIQARKNLSDRFSAKVNALR